MAETTTEAGLPESGPRAESAPAPAERLVSLDVYRGAVMFVLAAGAFKLKPYLLGNVFPDSELLAWLSPQWGHVPWAGWYFWDMIQPAFMFMVGVSMVYSYRKRADRGDSFRRMLGHALVRSLVLILLGVFMRTHKDMTRWTFEDVISLIGLGYVFLFLLWNRSWKVQAAAAAAILIGYWGLWRFWPQIAELFGIEGAVAGWPLRPGWYQGDFGTPGQMFDAWFLNLFPRVAPFTNHGYYTLNFIPSIATMIFGLMAGGLLRSEQPARRKVLTLLIAGVSGIALGWLLDVTGICPSVKKIWTPSWAIFSGGWCVLALAGFYWIVDVQRWRWWTLPFVVFGLNTIGVYVLAHYWGGWLPTQVRLHVRHLLPTNMSDAWANLLLALLSFTIFWLVFYWMYRRKIFLRI